MNRHFAKNREFEKEVFSSAKGSRWMLLLACAALILGTGCPPSGETSPTITDTITGTIDTRMPFRPNVCAAGGELGLFVVYLWRKGGVSLSAHFGGFPNGSYCGQQ